MTESRSEEERLAPLLKALVESGNGAAGSLLSAMRHHAAQNHESLSLQVQAVFGTTLISHAGNAEQRERLLDMLDAGCVPGAALPWDVETWENWSRLGARDVRGLVAVEGQLSVLSAQSGGQVALVAWGEPGVAQGTYRLIWLPQSVVGTDRSGGIVQWTLSRDGLVGPPFAQGDQGMAVGCRRATALAMSATLGVTTSAMHLAAHFLRARVLYGAPLATRPLVHAQLARMHIRYLASEAVVTATARLAHHRWAGRIVSACKAFFMLSVPQIMEGAALLLGARHYLKDGCHGGFPAMLSGVSHALADIDSAGLLRVAIARHLLEECELPPAKAASVQFTEAIANVFELDGYATGSEEPVQPLSTGGLLQGLICWSEERAGNPMLLEALLSLSRRHARMLDAARKATAGHSAGDALTRVIPHVADYARLVGAACSIGMLIGGGHRMRADLLAPDLPGVMVDQLLESRHPCDRDASRIAEAFLHRCRHAYSFGWDRDDKDAGVTV